ncbi:MAG: hypothetical protein B7Y12_04335 [Rhizobiales bacterium 24-66-13]|jgi:hypothetical protein|nr:MAG: hypothetical protein B7Y61_04865 [Rhizobiales bacterium 35-66-30]OYZ82228.1 MAG: hypothetical protein B7Y12_04335 [Rhizobiales bacterium 24-66-13]OZB07942.1 MAG: hypothetical protein B7X67_08180 [Rhizobiales bacterium 39-66-18]HQS45764.1 hypothetical protein [Xanthobacteraceae bacterium]
MDQSVEAATRLIASSRVSPTVKAFCYEPTYRATIMDSVLDEDAAAARQIHMRASQPYAKPDNGIRYHQLPLKSL